MNLWKHFKASYFFTLLRSFVIFTFILVLAAGALMGITLFESADTVTNLPDHDLSKYADVLSSEQYNRFPVRKLLGKQGYIAVVDTSGQIVYKSNPTVAPFSQESLAAIPLYEYHSYPIITTLTDDNGTPLTMISRNNWKNQDYTTQSIALLDESHNLVYGSLPLNATHLSDEAYGYMTQTLPVGYYIWKMPFQAQNGEQLWLIMYEQNTRLEEYSHISHVWERMIVLFLGVYVIILLAMSFWLSHKVRRPLDFLRHGLSSLAEQQQTKPIEYHGPQEFEEICGTFNQLALRLAQSEQQRQELEQGRQKMLADISHDLKTPITVIQGYSKAIHDGLIPADKVPQYLDIIYQKSIGLTDLINAFYEYSKLEHPDFTLAPTRLDLCEFLREYLALKYTELEVAGFVPDIDIPDTSMWCMLDRTCFVRVLENIISNAVKHNPSGTTLHFSIVQNGSYAVITLADNGVGIPAEIADHIFEPFVVGDESRNTKQGSGLGLAIGKKIVQAHGGSIRLVPAPPAPWRTAFEIRFPLL